jgi:hypothetical protein
MWTHRCNIFFCLIFYALRSVHSQPNLVVIMVDELNLRTIGAYRNLMNPAQAYPWGEDVFVDTPNIDKLAEQGRLYNNEEFDNNVGHDHVDSKFYSSLCRCTVQ